MRKANAAFVVLLFTAACASAPPQPTPATAPTTSATKRGERPDIRIVQISNVPLAARYAEGGMSVRYNVRVDNNALDAITLRRVTVQSVTDGAYYVDPTSMPFNLAIAPAKHREVQFWAPAKAGISMLGANGPVTLRVTCEFETTTGRFTEVVTRQVNERASINGQ